MIETAPGPGARLIGRREPASITGSGLTARAARQAAWSRIDQHAQDLVGFSHRLASRPELAFAEHFAAGQLTEALARGGLAVERAAYGLPTCVAGRSGRVGPHVVVCCEYDALPALGHACGHNVIAAAGLGAGLALAPLAGRLGGRLTVLGTPAEEGGGGKILLAEQGAFADVSAAVMVHPNAYETAFPHLVAAGQRQVVLHGRAAHTSLFPERGINALDALVLGYLAVAALRTHLPSGQLVSGVIDEGGLAPNVVPARAAGRFLLRAPSLADLVPLERRVRGCFAGAALAAEARWEFRPIGRDYPEVRLNRPLALAYADHAARLGRRLLPAGRLPASVVGSTDLGHVSRLVPVLHPMLAISSGDVVPHSRAFAAAAVSATADRAILDGAKALAATIIDLWLDAGLRQRVRAAFHATALSADRATGQWAAPAPARCCGPTPGAAAAPVQ